MPTPTPQPKLVEPKPDKMPTLVEDQFKQKFSDAGYRKAYGTGETATMARIRAIMTHRGRTPTNQRIRDIYKRRGAEFNTQGYDALRKWAGPTDPEAKHLDLLEIRQALAAISAKANLARGGLVAQRGATNRGFQMLDEQMGDARLDALVGAKSGAAGRGLLRSGLFLRETGDIAEDFAQQRAGAVAERNARLREIAAQLSGITAQEKADRASTARQLARAQVGPKGDIARALKLVEKPKKKKK